MRFKRLGPGYYYSAQRHNGQHIVIEKIGTQWALRREEERARSFHGSVKACKYALQEWISGNAELVS